MRFETAQYGDWWFPHYHWNRAFFCSQQKQREIFCFRIATTERRHFTQGNATEFSIDVAIVAEGRNQWYRLIHEKTGFAAYDRYYWNEAPSSEGLSARVAKLKQTHLWTEVRDAYLEKKNMYLRRQDRNHPSFNVYIEAVNEVYYRNFR